MNTPVSSCQCSGKPVCLLALTLFLMTAFQTYQILTDHGTLKRAWAAQEEPLKQAKALQEKLDKVALGTKALADKGNKNAMALVALLKERGVTIADKKAGQGSEGKAPAKP